MPAKKETKKPTDKSDKISKFSVPVYSLTGQTKGELSLPEEIFGAKVNTRLISQALRVYLTNQTTHFSNTKTRAEVSASTRKIFRQKGTGRARHGSLKAPIFVHFGGVALGPKYRKVTLSLPKKMKKAALISSLSQKFSDGEILGIEDLEKSSGKTKEMQNFLRVLNKKYALIIASESNQKALRATRNIQTLKFLPVADLNTFDVIKNQTLFFTKDAALKLTRRLLEGSEKNGIEEKQLIKKGTTKNKL